MLGDRRAGRHDVVVAATETAWLGSVGLLDDAGRVPQLVPEPIRALMA